MVDMVVYIWLIYHILTGNMKPPWANCPGEMHLPGMKFAGPGTMVPGPAV